MARRGRGFWAQLAFTVLVAAFLIVPVVMSITAGVTANFFQGVKSGLTTRWIGEVWRLYRDTIVLSMTIALATLIVDLAVGALFRPERATIVEPGAGQVKGRVATSFFLGDRTRLLVEGVSSGTLVVETTDRREWEPGQDVHLVIDPDALLTLDR